MRKKTIIESELFSTNTSSSSSSSYSSSAASSSSSSSSSAASPSEVKINMSKRKDQEKSDDKDEAVLFKRRYQQYQAIMEKKDEEVQVLKAELARNRQRQDELRKELEAEVQKMKAQAGRHHYRRGDFAEAKKILENPTLKTDASALYMLGMMAYRGWGQCIDQPKGCEYWKQAMALGPLGNLSKIALGVAYHCGINGVIDSTKAQELLKDPFVVLRPYLDQNDPDAQLLMGECTFFGLGAEPIEYAAYRWYEKSAAQENLEALRMMGVFCHHSPRGYPEIQDLKKAFEFFEKAAKKGDPLAQFNLAAYYRDGEVVPKNEVECVEWIKKAADKNQRNAQFELGEYYTKGFGVSRDMGRAIDLWLKSAESGNADAQGNLNMRDIEGSNLR